ncbi:hypothetical protein BJ742DRAFT_773053 [Cladochytrium replicatum]|nr:hypothetical protein BJ742DRAFT_773053 [Cladochytrium replicatum]
MSNLLILITALGSPVVLGSMLMSFWILILGIPVIVLRVIASISYGLIKSIWVRVVYRYHPPVSRSPRSDSYSGNTIGIIPRQTGRTEYPDTPNISGSSRQPSDLVHTTRMATDRGPSTTTTVVKESRSTVVMRLTAPVVQTTRNIGNFIRKPIFPFRRGSLDNYLDSFQVQQSGPSTAAPTSCTTQIFYQPEHGDTPEDSDHLMEMDTPTSFVGSLEMGPRFKLGKWDEPGV